MISDERLRAATKIVGDGMLEQYLAAEEPHEFSPEFERKMEKLIRRNKRQRVYAVLQKAACFVLAIALAGGVWLALDTEVRAEFFGWVREKYESFFHYQFEGVVQPSTQEYELGWLPDGYEFAEQIETENGKMLIYTDEKNLITFRYILGYGDTYLSDEDHTTILTTINGKPAQIYLSSKNFVSNAIVLLSDNQTMFVISAYTGEDELVKMAENITFKK